MTARMRPAIRARLERGVAAMAYDDMGVLLGDGVGAGRSGLPSRRTGGHVIDMRHGLVTLLSLALAAGAPAQAPAQARARAPRGPILDMHMHAREAAHYGPTGMPL